MNENNIATNACYDIINNILSNDILKTNCINNVKSYESTQAGNGNTTELIRFSRHISLETYFNNLDKNTVEITNDNTIKNSAINIQQNIDSILSELSSIANSNDYAQSDDTVLLLKLSSIIDNLLKESPITDRNIYLCRYFFAYPIEYIAAISGNSANSIEKTLASFNNKLKSMVKHNNLICDSKSMLLSFADIDDSYLLPLVRTCPDNKSTNSNNDNNDINQNNNETSDTNGISFKKNAAHSLPKFLNFLFAATIVVLAVLNIAQYTDKDSQDSNETPTATDDTISPTGFDKNAVYVTIDGKKSVNIEEILKYTSDVDGFEQSFTFDDRIFYREYYPIFLSADVPLSDYIGEEIAELNELTESVEKYTTYYKLMSTDSQQYIIRKFDEKYTLYKLGFVAFSDGHIFTEPDSTIKYHHILSTIYGLTRSTGIKDISILAADYDTGYADNNTKKVIYWDTDIENVFEILQFSSCNGNHMSKFRAENNLSNDYTLANSLQLIIRLKDNSTIDTIYYYPDENFFYDIDTELIFEPDANSNTTYLAEMLRFNNQKEEPVDPELWKLYLSCVETSPEYLAVTISSNPTDKVNGLYVGSEYTVEKLENDAWVSLPPGMTSVEYPFIAFDRKLDSSSLSSMLYFHLIEKYAPLEAGTYRLTITIYDSNSEDITNPACKDFYVQFIIKETDPNVTVNKNTYE